MSDQETQAESRPRGLLRGTFTRENAAVGWSSIWLGMIIGTSLAGLYVLLYSGLPYTGLLFVPVVWIAIRWSWRQLGGHSLVARLFLTILLAAWVLIPPLNYSFNLSCRRAVRAHRGIEVGPLFYLFGFAAFLIVWAPLYGLVSLEMVVLEHVGETGTYLALLGVFLLLMPLLILLYGRLINAMADRYGSPADSGTPTA